MCIRDSGRNSLPRLPFPRYDSLFDLFHNLEINRDIGIVLVAFKQLPVSFLVLLYYRSNTIIHYFSYLSRGIGAKKQERQPCLSCFLHHSGRIPAGRSFAGSHLKMVLGYSSVSVSYTHLDVYKRQVILRLRKAG